MRAQASLIVAPFVGQVLTPELAARLVALFPAAGRPLDLDQFPRLVSGRLVLAVERASLIWPELDVMHRLQWSETERYMDQPMDPDVAGILMDEAEGRMVQIVVRDQSSGAAAGHMRMYVTRSRHTRKCIAVEDTVYLRPEYRGGRNALRLVQFMEDVMKCIDVTGIYLDDKIANPAAGRMLDFLGYTKIANRRFKSLENPNVLA